MGRDDAKRSNDVVGGKEPELIMIQPLLRHSRSLFPSLSASLTAFGDVALNAPF